MNDLLDDATPVAELTDDQHQADPVSSTALQSAKESMSGAVAPAHENQDTALYAMIERLAVNPDVDVDKLNGILDLKERMMNKEAEQAFIQAMAAMQAEMPIIKKDGSVEYEKDGKRQKAFDYASFENIMRAVKPVMSKHGFSIFFDTDERQVQGGGAIIKATLSHKQGHSISTQFAAALDSSGGKNNIQAMGSTFSYGKRYCVTALLNIITEGEDDDGNAAFLDAPIDDAQFDEIQRLIDETATDAGKFCGHLKITSLRAMPQKMYARAAHDLKAKAAKMKAQGGAA